MSCVRGEENGLRIHGGCRNQFMYVFMFVRQIESILAGCFVIAYGIIRLHILKTLLLKLIYKYFFKEKLRVVLKQRILKIVE